MVYIDTEGSFVVQRALDVAAAAVRHCSLLAEDEEQRAAMQTFNVETILSSIFLVQTTGHTHKGHPKGCFVFWFSQPCDDTIMVACLSGALP